MLDEYVVKRVFFTIALFEAEGDVEEERGD
jgi:hypothetical protein